MASNQKSGGSKQGSSGGSSKQSGSGGSGSGVTQGGTHEMKLVAGRQSKTNDGNKSGSKK